MRATKQKEKQADKMATLHVARNNKNANAFFRSASLWFSSKTRSA